MCKVKLGISVCNIEDVKNVIIGIILQQKKNIIKKIYLLQFYIT